MIATHIVPARVAPEIMDYIFGAGAGSLRDTVQNALFINSRAEKAFDKGMFVIVPVDPMEQPRITRYKIVMSGEGNKMVTIGADKPLGECDGRELVFKTDFRPAQRFLFYRFTMVRLQMRRDRIIGWENFLLRTRTNKPWATVGKWMRKSLLPKLSEAALVERCIYDFRREFEEKEKMTDEEEAEIARRLVEAHKAQQVAQQLRP